MTESTPFGKFKALLRRSLVQCSVTERQSIYKIGAHTASQTSYGNGKTHICDGDEIFNILDYLEASGTCTGTGTGSDNNDVGTGAGVTTCNTSRGLFKVVLTDLITDTDPSTDTGTSVGVGVGNPKVSITRDHITSLCKGYYNRIQSDYSCDIVDTLPTRLHDD